MDRTRSKYARAGRCYESDLTDAEWRLIEPFMPPVKRLGRPRETDVRAVVDAILYIARTGCQWRLLPKDFPPHQTVYDYFRSWRFLGAWDRIHDRLRGDVREAHGRNREPSAGIINPGISGPAVALDRRAHFRLAQPLAPIE